MGKSSRAGRGGIDPIEVGTALPGVTVRPARDGVSLRVRDKGFAYVYDDGTMLVKATREEQQALVADDPEAYAASWAGGRFGWVAVTLAAADPGEVREIVTEAWRLTAPKKLAASLP